ncbi:hypothetical protein NIES4075_16010 [Tolypothrix sp. NIES-4075]|nr:hypothetical protein NIES4075_16010 [Tolypothrix sp. NIES-4075]
MGGIILRTSLLEPCVPLSWHTAPDIRAGFTLFAHVDLIMTGLMHSY